MDQYVALQTRIKRPGGWIQYLKLGLVVYLFMCGALTVMQRQLMYFPSKDIYVPGAWGLSDMKPVILNTDDGLELTSWHVPPTTRDKTVVFFQGNALDPGYRNYKIRSWMDDGYGVMQVVYRGFGGNAGKPTEKGLYSDARAAMKHLLASGVPLSDIIIYGESLGTGVAVQMATEFKVSGMILESPYSSTVDVAEWRYPLVPVSWLMQDRFESVKKISAVQSPLLIIHGTADTVVPFQFGEKLFAAANNPKQTHIVPGGQHNDVYNVGTRHSVLGFMQSLSHIKAAWR